MVQHLPFDIDLREIQMLEYSKTQRDTLIIKEVEVMVVWIPTGI